MNQLFLDGKLMDLGGEDITVTLRNNLFGDPSKLVSNTSYTVRLPKTVNNARALGLPSVAGADEAWHKTYHVARYLRNGVPLIDNGRAMLVSVSDTYEILIAFGAFSPVENIISSEAKLSDITGDETILFANENRWEDYDTALARGYFYAYYDPYYYERDSDIWVSQGIKFTQGDVKDYVLESGAILTASAGQTITTDIVPRQGMFCVAFPFTVGDSFSLSGVIGAADALPWCVIDANGVVLLTAGATTYTGTVNAPINAAMCVVNSTTAIGITVVDNDYVPDVPTIGFDNPAYKILPTVSVSWLLQKIQSQYGVTVDFGDGQTLIDTLAIPLTTKKANALTLANDFSIGMSAMLNQLGTADIYLNAESDVWQEQPLTPSQYLTAAVNVKITFEILIRWSWDASSSKPNVGDGFTHYHGNINGRQPDYVYYPAYFELIVEEYGTSDETVYVIGDGRQTQNYESNKVDGQFIHLAASHGVIELKQGDRISIAVRNNMGAPLYGQYVSYAQIYGFVDFGDEVPRGGHYPICENLPEVKITDFLRTLGILTGRYMRQNNASVLFTAYDDGMNRLSAVDWSTKVIMEGRTPRETKYRLENFAQRNEYKWKKIDQCKGDYNGVLTIDDDTMSGDAVAVELPFAATDGSNVPIYEKALKREESDYDGYNKTFYETTFKGSKTPFLKRVQRMETGKIMLTFDMVLQDCINEQVAQSLNDLLVIKEKMRLNDVEVATWSDARPVYLAQYGAFFCVLEITSDGSGTCDVTLLRLSGSTEPTPPTPVLPYDAEIEYIQTDGAAYINTGIKPSSNTTFEIDVYIPNHGSTAFWVFGSRVSGSAGQFAYLNDGGFNRKSYRFGNQSPFASGKLAEGWHYFDNTETPRILKIDTNITLTATANTFAQTNYPIYLLCLNVNGTASAPAVGARLGDVKIYESGELVFDGFPVRKDGIGYLYDRVTEELFGNAGTGVFVLGNDKN